MKNPDGDTHGVPKHGGGDVVHLLFIYSTARKVGVTRSCRNALVSTGLAQGPTAIFFEYGNKLHESGMLLDKKLQIYMQYNKIHKVF